MLASEKREGGPPQQTPHVMLTATNVVSPVLSLATGVSPSPAPVGVAMTTALPSAWRVKQRKKKKKKRKIEVMKTKGEIRQRTESRRGRKRRYLNWKKIL